MRWTYAIVCSIAPLLACTGDHPTSVEGTGTTLDTLVVLSGDRQAVIANQPLAAIRVRVQDASGRGVPNVPLKLVTEADTSVLRRTAVSDPLGVASFDDLVLSRRAGEYVLAAVVVGGKDTTRLRATVAPTAPKAIVGAPYPASTAYMLNFAYGGQPVPPFALAVRDSFDNAIPGLAVRLTDRSGGRIADSVVTTNAEGITPLIRWTLSDQPTADTLTAVAGPATARWVANVLSGAPAAIIIDIGNDQQVAVGGAAASIYGSLRDANGLPISGAIVTWTDAASGQIVCQTMASYGSIRMTPLADPPCDWRPGTAAGTYTLRVSSGAAVATVSATVMAKPSAIRLLSDPAAGRYFLRGTSPADDVVVQLTLSDGSPAVGYPIRIATYVPPAYPDPLPLLTPLSSSQATTDAQGIVRVRWLLGGEPAQYQFVATVAMYPDLNTYTAAVVYGQPRFAYLAAGEGHSCGMPPSSDGRAPRMLCWGRNAERQLADSTTTRRLVPTLAGIFDGAGAGYYGMTARGNTTCATFTYSPSSAPPLDCWGASTLGQAGTASAVAWPPVEVQASDRSRISLGGPTLGSTHGCAASFGSYDGKGPSYSYSSGLRCWGDNRFGQLGDGTTTSRTAAATIDTTRFRNMSRVVVGAGDGFTCAVDGNGAAWCWGRNTDGELGDGTTTNHPTPGPVAGNLRFQPVAGALAVGLEHACAIATDGLTYCWGSNGSGQLGNGGTDARTSPTAVSAGARFVTLAAGNAHTCGLTADGTAYCWGSNDRGQLGTGTAGGTARTPTLVAGGRSFAIIVGGGHHTCSATPSPDYSAYCWGSNAEGQLGDGTTTDHYVPVPVAIYRPPPVDPAAISASHAGIMKRVRR